ncbi:DUF309 domain-containing protein [Aquibium carbonis]|uniref:DUF309 domain-containing protein n=1 Tax=Aquibium carbonis TaxID=2495581 RepID=A0A429YX00_9HYPH|nr:DUF309 domain-containing protein [Aquibium carbonis]RST85978.1 DUF309 domain-containing protein [Aquibium carbonis]
MTAPPRPHQTAAVASWPLPATAFVPGRDPRPEEGLFITIADRAQARTDPAAWQVNEAWCYGFQLYGGGFFWEAHEVWEPVWAGAAPNSAERHLVQGLIQLANACLKLRMERQRATLRLIRDARLRLAEAGAAPLMGIEPGQVLAAICGFALRIEAHAGNELSALIATRPVLSLSS